MLLNRFRVLTVHLTPGNTIITRIISSGVDVSYINRYPKVELGVQKLFNALISIVSLRYSTRTRFSRHETSRIIVNSLKIIHKNSVAIEDFLSKILINLLLT